MFPNRCQALKKFLHCTTCDQVKNKKLLIVQLSENHIEKIQEKKEKLQFPLFENKH